MTAHTLRIVPEAPTLEQEPIDIYASWKAEIRARNWSAVHIAGDRRAPVYLPDAPRRGWRG